MLRRPFANAKLNVLSSVTIDDFKGRVQFVMNKCFLLTLKLKKIPRRSILLFLRKMHSNSENMTSPSRRLGYS